MNWEFTWQALPYAVALSITLIALIIAATRRKSPGGLYLIGFLFAVAIWVGAAMLENGIFDPTQKLFWARVRYIGIMSVPVFWFAFAVNYTNRSNRLPLYGVIILFLVPAFVLFLIWSDTLASFIFQNIHELNIATEGLLNIEFATGFWISQIYNTGLIILGSLWLLLALPRASSVYRGQSLTLLLAALLPWIANIVDYFAYPQFLPIPTTAFGFALGGLCLVYGIFRFRVLDITPIARTNIIESMTDAVFVTDQKHRVVDVNVAGANLVFSTPETLIGTELGTVFETQLNITNVLTEGVFKSGLLAVGDTPNTQYFETTYSPLRSQSNEVSGYYLILHDVTARKLAEDEILHAKKEVEEANEAKTQFLATISHEIRTPLNAVLGLTDLILLDDNLTNDQRHSLEQVRTSGDMLVKMLNDLLDLSKIDAGKLGLEKITFNLHDLAANTVELFAPRAIIKALDIRCEIDPGVPELVTGDPTRLRQILFNLLSNAIKFTERGSVVLQVEGGDVIDDVQKVTLSVTDTGIGIPKDKQDAIFEPFQQETLSTARKYGGTGLGLAIAMRLTELMGPGLKIRSKVGRGTKFFFDVDFGFPGEEKSPLGNLILGQAHFDLLREDTPLRILVAEDDPINQMVLRQLLERRNHKITIVDNGQSAVSLSKHEQFDLILMDLQMPELNGLEATLAIREYEQKTGEHLPIVALTANATAEDRRMCLAAGMDSHLTKPIEVDALYATIAALIHSTQKDTSDLLLDQENAVSMFDFDEVTERCGGDKDLAIELLQMFHDSWPESLDTIEAAIADQDADLLERTAHTLKGTASTLSAGEVSKIAYDLQVAGKNADFETSRTLTQKLARALKRVDSHLAEFVLLS